ncbi:hypothetical protein BH10PSE19_BH10PSE19_03480 [soil metagenome]
MLNWFKTQVLLQGRDKSFVSDIDKFLEKFNKKLTKSASQRAEIKKYQRVFQLRDNPAAGKTDLL